MVAGCGSVKDSGTIDAPVGDAGPDADESGNVTVTTKGFVGGQTTGAAVPDIDLISALPDGTPFATSKTDAAGSGTIKVVPGGSVTAVYKRMAPDLSAELVTYVGVKVGDTLEFGNPSIPFTGNNVSIGSQTYSWPNAPNPNVQQYRAATSCNSNGVAVPGTSVAFSEFSACNKSPMDVVYTAFQSATNGLLHCGSRQNLTFASGATVALSGWQNAVSFLANITGLPASLGSPSASVSTSLRAVIDGQTPISLPNGGNANGVASGGAFTGNMQWCNVGDRTQAMLTLNRQGFQSIRIFDFLPSNATSWTVASPMLPPWVENSGVFTSVSRGLAQWTLVDEGTNATDAVYLQLGYDVRINNNFFFGQWHFIMPPGTDSLQVPKLPSTFAELVPSQDFGMFANRMYVVEIPTVSGYDALRAMGTGVVLCPDCVVRSGEVQRVITSGF